MSNSLYGFSVSSTFQKLVQVVDGSYYDGLGNLLNIGSNSNTIGITGPQGPTGQPGVSLMWMGSWTQSMYYVNYDAVSYNGSSYICLTNNPQNPPGISPSEWDILAKSGETNISSYIYVTASYNVSNKDHYIEANGTFDVTLPSSLEIKGQSFIIKNTGTGIVTIKTTNSELIDKLPSYNLSFYDSIELESNGSNWLVFKPETKRFTRVYNNTGATISKSSALRIISSYNGIPAVSLAISSGTGSQQVIGLAYIDIPNNSEGIILNAGILSGLNLSNYNIGDVLYLSDKIAGGFVNSISMLNYSSRINQIGYVTSNSSTLGTIQIEIINEDTNLSLTDLQRNILEGNVISTGTYEFLGLTISGPTTFSINPMKGWIVSNTGTYSSTNPTVNNIIFNGATGISALNISSEDNTYVLIGASANVITQNNFPTPEQRRMNIFLGKIVHPNHNTIQNVNNTVDFDVSPVSMIRDIWTPIRLINDGIMVSPNDGNLSLNISSGYLWGNGINWANNQLNPNQILFNSQSLAVFQYRTSLGATATFLNGAYVPFTNITSIIPDVYESSPGVISNITAPNAQSTNIRVYVFPTGLIRLQFGQKVYPNLTTAAASISSENFNIYSNNSTNGILIGIISVTRNATNLSDPTEAIFTSISKFGEILGGAAGGAATTNLQQAFNNSNTNPDIVTNNTNPSFIIQNGDGSDITDILIVQSLTGSNTFYVNGYGDVIGKSFAKINGTSSEFLKSDGSIDSNMYLTQSSLLPYLTIASYSTIKGATGATGPQGIQGITGATGPGFTFINPSTYSIIVSNGSSNSFISYSNFNYNGNTLILGTYSTNILSTFYISGSATGSTNSYSLYVNSGPSYFGSSILLGSTVSGVTISSPVGQYIFYNTSGGIIINTSNNQNLQIGAPGSGYVWVTSGNGLLCHNIITTNTQLAITAGSGQFIRLGSNNTEQLRITSSGNTLIGTQTDNGIDKVQINGSLFLTTINTISYATGSLLFSNGSSIAQNNSKLFWDNINFRLSVGTASPIGAFNIYSTASSGQDLYISKGDSGIPNQGGGSLYFDNTHPVGTGRNPNVSAGKISFRFSQPSSGTLQESATILVVANNQSGVNVPADIVFSTFTLGGSLTEKMRITATGSIGIGTSVPTSQFTQLNSGSFDQSNSSDRSFYTAIVGANKTIINGINSGMVGIIANDGSPTIDYGGSIVFGAKYNTSGQIAIQAGIRSGRDDSTNGNYGGYFSILTRANGATMSERIRITSSGNIGIGTTGPQKALQINGSGLRLSLNGTNYTDFTPANDGAVGVSVNGATKFYIGASSLSGIEIPSAYSISFVQPGVQTYANLKYNTTTSLFAFRNGGDTGDADISTGKIFTSGPVYIGVNSSLGLLTLGGNRSATAWGTSGINFQTISATYSDITSSEIVANNMINTFGIPTLGASNSTTYINSSTVYISGSPISGTNVTITNPFSLYIAGGNSFFGGNVIMGGTASTIRLKIYTVSTLPIGTQGDIAAVSDATSPTYLGILIGGGTAYTPVTYDGSKWVSY